MSPLPPKHSDLYVFDPIVPTTQGVHAKDARRERRGVYVRARDTRGLEELLVDVRALFLESPTLIRRQGPVRTREGSQIPLSDTAVTLMAEWKAYVGSVEPDTLVFSTKAGTPILPNNVLRRFIFPACTRLGLPRATWLTFRRTYSSWSHDRGVPGKVVAQLMGHANVDTMLNVYTQVLDGSLRQAVEKVGGEFSLLFTKPSRR
jgi:integrase